jgi:hypothetical protein
MLAINYPEPVFRLKKEQGKEYLFDPVRKKWILLTEEEWVRQNFVQYLVQVKEYPLSLIALEKLIYLGELRKRFDILVYDRNHQPWMMIECKEMRVKLDDEVLNQVLRYNLAVPVPYIVITNGQETFGWEKAGDQLQSLLDLPPLP